MNKEVEENNRMGNTKDLDELQAGIKKGSRNINNLRYADDTTPMAESEESEETPGLKLNIK